MTGLRIDIRGTVQGVGFRPWVARLARRSEIAGRVRNNAVGVRIEVFGPQRDLARFVERLRTETPPSARIVELRAVEIPHERMSGFVIAPSAGGANKALSIPPDLATCPECEREVLDPSDRRYRYAFTNCTSCGPRFTIATGIPYDRPTTTMAEFQMCDACAREYGDQDDRRFHAQPNACPTCGPKLRFVDLRGETAADAPLERASRLLIRGGVVAVKGLGGFHLACDATNASSVVALRERKRRDEKPFAVMVRDLDAAHAAAYLSPEEEALMASPERPIVLVARRGGGAIAGEVSPDTPLLGLFLPYTPLHHLLLEAVGRPLVMTSANVAEEPICKGNDEALDRLARIADALVLHDRDIAMRCDDSIVRVIAGAPTLIRRSRGFVPRPFMLERPVGRPVLACGAHLKNTFCLAAGDTAYFGPHIGDLETVAALEFFEEAIERMQDILSIRPEVIAHDLHPGYLSTRYAQRRSDAERVGVQHHHAHVVSALVENRIAEPVLGVAFDGTGFGTDGTSWGGEFLWCTPQRFERVATFRAVMLPGGNLAMREVWRIAYALLHDAFDGNPPIDDIALFDGIPRDARQVVAKMVERELNAPKARGVGRYFDAFGALGLDRAISSYEGQVAVAWNFAAEGGHDGSYPFVLDRDPSPLEIDLRPAVRAMVEDLRRGVSPGRISARFHDTIVEATVTVSDAISKTHGTAPIVLTGGVFQNDRLASDVYTRLLQDHRVFRHREVPPGDGGIAVGQALIADAIVRDKGS